MARTVINPPCNDFKCRSLNTQITPWTKHERTPWSTSGRLISHQTSFWSQAECYQSYTQMLAVGGVYTDVIYGLKNWQRNGKRRHGSAFKQYGKLLLKPRLRECENALTQKKTCCESSVISAIAQAQTRREPQAKTFTWRWRSRLKGSEKFPWKGFNQMLGVLLKCPFCSIT